MRLPASNQEGTREIVAKVPMHVHSTHMDFVTSVESDTLYPIAFRNREALNNWASGHGLHSYKIGSFTKDKSAVSLRGSLSVWPSGGIFYSQVWVRARFKNYRKSILRHLVDSNDLDGDVGKYDADHAVSKKRLTKEWPDAWVNLTLVDHSINRSVGAMLEKEPLLSDSSSSVIYANLEFLLKLFCQFKGRMTRDELQAYFDEAGNRFLSNPTDLDSFVFVNNANVFLTKIADDNGLKNSRRPAFMHMMLPH